MKLLRLAKLQTLATSHPCAEGREQTHLPTTRALTGATECREKGVESQQTLSSVFERLTVGTALKTSKKAPHKADTIKANLPNW